MRNLHYYEASGGGAFLADGDQEARKSGILKILGYYGSKAIVSIVKFFPLLGDGFIRGQEARKSRGQASLEGRNVRRYEGRPFTLKGLFPNCQSLPSCFDITSSCKTQMAAGTATLPIVALFDDIRQATFNLVKGNMHVATYNNIRRAAFTLAEVLITLGIIGVVAAMTMPSLIQEHREKATVAKLKKVYSNLNNAFILSISEYGSVNDWGITSAEIDNKGSDLIARRLKEFMISAKDCNSDGGCFGEDTYKTLGPVSERFSGAANTFSTFILADGTSIGIWGVGSINKYGMIIVDINGKQRPNTTGKDAFWFKITENSIVPLGLKGETEAYNFENCINPVSAYYTSRGCTAWVIFNENMDYLHCKDLSWEGKTRCK